MFCCRVYNTYEKVEVECRQCRANDSKKKCNPVCFFTAVICVLLTPIHLPCVLFGFFQLNIFLSFLVDENEDFSLSPPKMRRNSLFTYHIQSVKIDSERSFNIEFESKTECVFFFLFFMCADNSVSQLTEFSPQELIEKTLYQYIHAADVQHIRDSHLIRKLNIEFLFIRILEKKK